MFLKLVTKKIFNRFIYGKYSHKKQQRNPSSFQDCIESPERSRIVWKPAAFILVLLVIIYYMLYSRGSGPNPGILAFDESKLANEHNEGTDSGEIVISHKNLNHELEENDTAPAIDEIKYKRPERLFFIPGGNLPLCASVTVGADKDDSNSTNSTKQNFPKTVNSIDPGLALDMGIRIGGHYIPKDCNPRHRVAILVPYRNRQNNLNMFLYFIHPFLIRQNIEYRIFVIEQAGKKPFNKGRLFNAGFLEIQRNDEWQCVVFHDVDLLPADDRIRYSCPVLPRHMCALVLGKEHIMKYNTVFGGVTAMTMWQYKKTNGYSNSYTGKGESADMFKRLQAAGLGVTRYRKNFAKYFSLKHPFRPENHRARDILLSTAVTRYQKDGLTTILYSLVSFAFRPLYTHIVVNVNIPRNLPNYITESFITLSP